MPRSPEQNSKIRTNRKTQILDAAMRVYRDWGYSGAEMGKIAQEAGLGRGLIYYYFKNKQNLFLELIEYRIALWKERSQPIVEMNATIPEKLSAYLREICLMAIEHPDVIHFHQTISRDLHKLFPEREEWVTNKYDQGMWEPVRSLIHEGIRTGELRTMKPEIAENLYISVLLGTLGMEQELLLQSMDQLIDGVLYGLVERETVRS
ncbi:TetR/AcrR family transcriptional regulator [Mechercharimyces sp. CAU 1602]|uniref:TetR/AcrR family transcriptional regulator n=1 Tax=Mechercharimyces sp. CAU 1602 TaxID=2973933 RepID=UPI002161ECCA|nr:TetR/AcrR family transcriptional regulator [Mechercharimyces sp. CAU 1602]MCS1352213.1 TetR/AcrR family transcriptional regulator [Mechercharimyces sp. CAU 1602]